MVFFFWFSLKSNSVHCAAHCTNRLHISLRESISGELLFLDNLVHANNYVPSKEEYLTSLTI